jgi:hypothetical protein
MKYCLRCCKSTNCKVSRENPDGTYHIIGCICPDPITIDDLLKFIKDTNEDLHSLAVNVHKDINHDRK